MVASDCVAKNSVHQTLNLYGLPWAAHRRYAVGMENFKNITLPLLAAI